MTIKEFEEYLQSYNKQAGEFTKDEIFEIGKKFRTVDEKKNWSVLAEKVGWSSGENLRTFVKNRIYRNPISPEAIESTNPNTVAEQLSTLYKERTKNRDILNEYRRKLRDEARIEVLEEIIKSSAAQQANLPKVIVKPFEIKGNNEAVLLLSDLHIGVECDNYYNKYNSEIAAQSLSNLATETLEYCKRNKVKRLNILNLGDLIHGHLRTSSRLEQEDDTISQVMIASELVAQFLNQIQTAAPEIIYRSVSDNHSRLTPNYNEHVEKENFYRLIDWYLEERLKNTNIKMEDDNVDISIGYFKLLNGKTAIFTHGHLGKKTSVVQDMAGLLRIVPDYVFMGHYHKAEEHSFQGSKVYVNGSIVGTEQYAFSQRLFSQPEQKLLIFEKDNVTDITIKVR